MTASPPNDVYDPFSARLPDPYPFYAGARVSEPVFFSEAINAWVVTRWSDVHEVLRQPEAFSSGNSIRPMTKISPKVFALLAQVDLQRPATITTDGEEHRRRREPLTRTFGREAVAAHEPFIRARVKELVDAFPGDGRVELRGALTDPLPLDTLVRASGFDPADAPLIHTGAVALAQLFGAPHSEDEQIELAQTAIRAQQLAVRYVRERQANPGDDFSSRLIRMHLADRTLAHGQEPQDADGQTLTSDQEAHVVVEVTNDWIAEHLTTQGILANGVRALLEHRDQWELLVQRPELRSNAVEEILRWDSSVPGLLRVATRPVTLAGREFPPGSEFALMFGAANRDPALVGEPERFDISRPPSRHVTFGHGVHFCAGAPLARLQLTAILEELPRRLPGLRLAEDFEPAIVPSFNVRVPRTLEVTW